MLENRLQQSLSDAREGLVERFRYECAYIQKLDHLWNPEGESELVREVPDESSDNAEFCFAAAEPEPTPWTIAFTPTFLSSIAKADRKLQGRILKAIAELSEAPFHIRGDTKKPLVNELNGLWRYRIGDHRLVYQPSERDQTVILLEFGSRGKIYDR